MSLGAEFPRRALRFSCKPSPSTFLSFVVQAFHQCPAWYVAWTASFSYRMSFIAFSRWSNRNFPRVQTVRLNGRNRNHPLYPSPLQSYLMTSRKYTVTIRCNYIFPPQTSMPKIKHIDAPSPLFPLPGRKRNPLFTNRTIPIHLPYHQLVPTTCVSHQSFLTTLTTSDVPHCIEKVTESKQKLYYVI